MSDQPIIAEVERFLKRTGMAESAFGRRAVNDWKFVRDLRQGRELRRSTEQRIRNFMSACDAKAHQVAA